MNALRCSFMQCFSEAPQNWKYHKWFSTRVLFPAEYKEVIMSSSYVPATTESLDQAQEAKNPTEAISIIYRILENPSSSSEALRIKERPSRISQIFLENKTGQRNSEAF
ncbi:hypothetical protein LOK49_LG06G01857 [Camellia lanceoleosa]|uniref:Uncharacterized protein n=1 Tax=Camellia lanceoleosa TaxID=1840588 RepID=A0ACC0HDQ6_9ERIC|nr:hypothetical protein LOK49_LG06G01857 [Camellia lanceoleosa]